VKDTADETSCVENISHKRELPEKYNKTNFSLAASFQGICLLSAFILLE